MAVRKIPSGPASSSPHGCPCGRRRYVALDGRCSCDRLLMRRLAERLQQHASRGRWPDWSSGASSSSLRRRSAWSSRLVADVVEGAGATPDALEHQRRGRAGWAGVDPVACCVAARLGERGLRAGAAYSRMTTSQPEQAKQRLANAVPQTLAHHGIEFGGCDDDPPAAPRAPVRLRRGLPGRGRSRSSSASPTSATMASTLAAPARQPAHSPAPATRTTSGR